MPSAGRSAKARLAKAFRRDGRSTSAHRCNLLAPFFYAKPYPVWRFLVFKKRTSGIIERLTSFIYMCGIVGYIGDKAAEGLLMEGLQRLEYRGYDSAGLAVVDGSLTVRKQRGKVGQLKATLNGGLSGTLGIGHTRWATHGFPNDVNAHPHTNAAGDFALVHNGHYRELHGAPGATAAKGLRFSERHRHRSARPPYRRRPQGDGASRWRRLCGKRSRRSSAPTASPSSQPPTRISLSARGREARSSWAWA